MLVTYKGARARDDLSSEFVVKHEGQAYVLREGQAVEVPDELGSELVAGKGRIAGHKFAEQSDPDATESGDTGGTDAAPLGGGSGPTSGGGTATAAART